MNTLSILKAHTASAFPHYRPVMVEAVAMSRRQQVWDRYAESRKAVLAPTPTPASTVAGTSTSPTGRTPESGEAVWRRLVQTGEEQVRSLRDAPHGTARALSGRWDWYGDDRPIELQRPEEVSHA